MKVAIIGCLHGMLDEMYKAIYEHEKQSGQTIELVLVCGDCQTIRHFDDLVCLAVPNKYKRVGDFHEYYAGRKKVPKLTIFVGGNHEASNYLMTLPYGGWVCENFYYLGYAGVIRYRGFRIAGVSGIYNYHNCRKGRYEKLPLDPDSIRSIYHTRHFDVFRLQLLGQHATEDSPIDLFLSHDWPCRIYNYGNKQQLMRFKPDFRQDIESRNGLGNQLTETLVGQLKPRRWFAAHLHCKFYAKVFHNQEKTRVTEFLSLNKIENRRNFMDVIDIEPQVEHDESIYTKTDTDDDSNEYDLFYDPEWLTVLKKTLCLELNVREKVACPRIEDESAKAFLPTDDEVRQTIELMKKSGGLKIKRNFKMTEPVIYDRPTGCDVSKDRFRTMYYANHQTEELFERLELDPNKIPHQF